MKLNKLAFSVAAVCAASSTGVMAVVDLDATDDSQIVHLATEAKQTLDANGRLTYNNFKTGTAAACDQGGGNGLLTLFDVTAESGYATAALATRHYRFDLGGNAVFGAGAAPTLSQVDNEGGADSGASAGALSTGGTQNDTFAIFEVPDDAAGWSATSHFTLHVSSFDFDPTQDATITYAMYETASNAVSQTSALVTKTKTLANFIAGSDSDHIVGNDATATVASSFKNFDTTPAATQSTTVHNLATVTVANADNGTATYTCAGAEAVAADFITASQTITVTGDVSVGDFAVSAAANCGTPTALVKAADNASASATWGASAVDHYICLTVDGTDDVIAKGSYTVSYGTDGVSKAIGSVSYDTTTVEAPYISTYEGYNQRIIIDNRGAAAAYYSTTFTTEAGVTATAGTAATGTVPANTMAVVKVSDLVTFDGGSRGSATMEIEAAATSVWVTSQIVDLGTGMTDTTLLYNGSCNATIVGAGGAGAYAYHSCQ